MKKISRILALCLALVCIACLIASCKNSDSGYNGAGADGGSTSTSLLSETTRKVVYTVDLDLEIKNVGERKKLMESKCKELGGYVARSSEGYDGGECDSLNATYRVPTDKLDEFVEFCEKDVRVINKSVTTRDITSSAISAKAERDYLNQKKAIIEGMLNEEGITAKEQLEILDSLAQVNKEIMALEENIKANTSSYEYSTVLIYLTQPTTFGDVIVPLIFVIGVPAGTFCAIFFGIRITKKKNRERAKMLAQENK